MYKILLADDEPWIIIRLKNMICWEKYGFRIIGEARDGAEAWNLIEKEKPDAVISDIRMPGLDGLKLLEKIEEARLMIRVILISGYAEFEYAQKAVKLGAFDYLLKQISREDLITTIERLRIFLDGMNAELPRTSATGNRIISDMMQNVKEHYMEKLLISDMACHYNVSQGYLSDLFKKETGMNFSEYLTEIRITKAKQLLTSTEKSIYEIAEAVGYTDYYYFTKIFAKITGISPSKFRKKDMMKIATKRGMEDCL